MPIIKLDQTPAKNLLKREEKNGREYTEAMKNDIFKAA